MSEHVAPEALNRLAENYRLAELARLVAKELTSHPRWEVGMSALTLRDAFDRCLDEQITLAEERS